jgi:three-Cys-motif partner protein
MNVSAEHGFGGDWTSQKLAILAKYLWAYTTALKHQHRYSKGYIDAFAGTGYRTNRPKDSTRGDLFDDFPDLAGGDTKALLDGSARIALKTDPAFDGYVFIEKNKQRCDALEQLKTEFPSRKIDIRQGEANTELKKICGLNWDKRRAVLFLDPYGMQVEWETVVAVSKTYAIDMWLLIPLGIGINRLLTNDGDIPSGWRRRLDILLGTNQWFDEFYRTERVRPTLFDDPDQPKERLVKAKVETIAGYLTKRLQGVFPNVASSPIALRNSQGNPMYLLHFASAHAGRGGEIAVGIANDLLRDAE